MYNPFHSKILFLYFFFSLSIFWFWIRLWTNQNTNQNFELNFVHVVRNIYLFRHWSKFLERILSKFLAITLKILFVIVNLMIVTVIILKLFIIFTEEKVNVTKKKTTPNLSNGEKHRIYFFGAFFCVAYSMAFGPCLLVNRWCV